MACSHIYLGVPGDGPNGGGQQHATCVMTNTALWFSTWPVVAGSRIKVRVSNTGPLHTNCNVRVAIYDGAVFTAANRKLRFNAQPMTVNPASAANPTPVVTTSPAFTVPQGFVMPASPCFVATIFSYGTGTTCVSFEPGPNPCRDRFTGVYFSATWGG